MSKRRGSVHGGRRPTARFHLLSGVWTFLFVLAITIALLGVSLGVGKLTGSSERVKFDRVLESRAIDALQADPATYLDEVVVIQGQVQTIERGWDLGGAPADVVVVGGLEEGHAPLRVFVTGGTPGVFPSSIIHAAGTGAPDPIEPTRLAVLTSEVTVIPISTSDVTEVAGSVLAFASVFGALMAALGIFWERHALALPSQSPVAEEAAVSAPETPRFLTALTRGKDPRSVLLRMAFLAALGRALFVFGLIAFLYVFFTVYVLEAAAVDWWVHHWVPWLRLDVFAALGLIAAFVGLFLFTFVQELGKKS